MIKFIKEYPDFSRLPYCADALKVHEERCIEYLIYIALFLDKLPDNSLIVYSGPEQGFSLIALSPLLSPHRVILVENYCMLSKTEPILKASIDEVSRTVDVTLIEADFEDVWHTLSDVDFLLLDGPPTTTNFAPFSDNFFYMMHEIYLRLRPEFFGMESSGDSLIPYLPYLCRINDTENILNLKKADIPNDYKLRHDTFYYTANLHPMGTHGWLKGIKEDD